MKSQIIKLIFLSALALTAPLLTFAGGQDGKLQAPGNAHAQNVPDTAPQAVQQGKDSGLTRSDVYLRAEAPRVETPEERVCVQQGKHTCPNWNDTAFHK